MRALLPLLLIIILLPFPHNHLYKAQEEGVYDVLSHMFKAAFNSARDGGYGFVLPFLYYKRRDDSFLTEYLTRNASFPFPSQLLAMSTLYLYLATRDPNAYQTLAKYADLIKKAMNKYGFLVPLNVLTRDARLRNGLAITSFERVLDVTFSIELSRLGLLNDTDVAKGIINYYRFIGFFNGTDLLNEGVVVMNGRIYPYTLLVSENDLPRQHAQVFRPLVRAIEHLHRDGGMLHKALRSLRYYLSPLGYIRYRPNMLHTLEMFSSKYILNLLISHRELGLPTDNLLMIGLFQSVSGYDGYPLLRRRTYVISPGGILYLLPNIHGIKYYEEYAFRPYTPQYRPSIAALNALYVPMMLWASGKYVELSDFYIYYIKKIYETSVFNGFLYSMYDQRKGGRIITSELYAPAYLVDLLYERVTAGYPYYIMDAPYFNPGFRSYVIPKNKTLVIPLLSTGLLRFNVPIEEVKVYNGELLYRNSHQAYVIGENVTLYAKIGSPANLHLYYDPKGDSDRDGIPDINEIHMGLDPFNRDTDGDGLIDSRDPYPRSADGDLDGVLDPIELMFGSDPSNRFTFGAFTDYVYVMCSPIAYNNTFLSRKVIIDEEKGSLPSTYRVFDTFIARPLNFRAVRFGDKKDP